MPNSCPCGCASDLGFLVFVTQSPAGGLRSTISHSILEQVATKIFLPNPFGQRRDYIEGFSLSEAEFKLVREELSPESRKFLVKQGHDSVVVGLDLIGMDDELAVLSGRAETTGVAREVIAELGNDPKLWLPEFHRRSEEHTSELQSLQSSSYAGFCLN